jgi:molecular chaperone Hsp33
MKERNGKDYLVRAITRDANIRGLACVTSGLVDDVCKRHDAYPTACAALGRALTGGALMGALLKTGQRVALRFEGDGPLKKIVVEADSNGAVRGLVRVPQVDLPLKGGKLDVAGALGSSGLLIVTKDLRLKEPYTGMVGLHSGEIAEDLAFYLTESEQVPSAVGLGVYVEPDRSVGTAGGFLIQSFPPFHHEVVDEIVKHIEKIPPITEQLRKGETPESMLELIFQGLPFEILEKRDLFFRCSCSKERVESALISLGREELEELVSQQGQTDVRCEFCLETYHLTREDLMRLLQ